MRNFYFLTAILVLTAILSAQTDSAMTSPKPASALRDSLEFAYNENLVRIQDSLQQNFDLQKQKFLNKYNIEREQYSNKIKMLADSIQILKSLTPEPQLPVENMTKTDDNYDKNYEHLYFQYLTSLKDREEKKSFLGFGSEKLTDFKLLEMKNYLDKYFPSANSEKIQSYILEICFAEKMYPEAEMELLKYAYLYIENDNYPMTIDKNLKEIENIRYYKNRSAFIVKKVNSILKNTSISERYFQFIELLNSYPDEKVREFLQQESKEYLKNYIQLPRSADVVFWIANEYIKTNEPHKAFITADKLMNNYPNHKLFAEALYFQAAIQEEQFKEYKEAIDTYEKFILKFPDHTKAQAGMYKIPVIFDTELKDYESAVSYYKQFADKYQDTDQAVIALQRAAEIYNKEMKALQSSVDTYTLIEQRYPNTKDGIDALLMTGTLYESSKYYKTAVVQYAEVYKKYPKTDQSLTALEQSALLYLEKLDDKDNSIKVLNLIIEYFPGTKSAKQAAERLESLTEAEAPPVEEISPIKTTTDEGKPAGENTEKTEN